MLSPAVVMKLDIAMTTAKKGARALLAIHLKVIVVIPPALVARHAVLGLANMSKVRKRRQHADTVQAVMLSAASASEARSRVF